MRESTRITAFILVAIGTVGLLINEFIFDWGRLWTVGFAIFNVVGLTTLAITFWRREKT